MKTIATTVTTHRNAASTLNSSHSTHTAQSPLRRLTLLVTLLMTFALGARAAEYVFYNANYGYYLALNGTNLVRTNTFNPSTCVWTGPDGNSGTFSIKSGNSTYYLRYSDGLTTTTNNNNATAWTIDNNKVYYRSGGNNYYIRYSNSNQAFQARTYDSQNEILYKCVLESVAASSGEKSYTVSLTSVAANPAVLDYNKSTTVTANGGSVTITTTTTPAHTKYTLTPNSGSGTTTVYYSQDGGTVSTTSPASQTTSTAAVTGYEWAVSPSNYTTLGNATTTANTNAVTYSTASGTNTTVTLSATAYYTERGQTHKSTAVNTTLTLNEKKDDPTGITANDLTLAVDEQKSISYTLTPSNANDVIAYSNYDNTIISIDANGVVKGLKAGITTVTLTAKKLDGTDGPTTTSTVAVTPKAPTIEFPLGANITATINTTETGATIYYTTDGTTPTTRSQVYTPPVSVTAGATVKAIVVVTASDGTKLISPVAEALANAESGRDGNTVFLYDLEDHNWTYYSGVNTSVDGGNYNTNYKGKIYSPNPRNVKITYNGVNGISGSSTNVKVSISESENAFVYYKTLEQGSTSGEYPYQVISNPFSVRPSTGSGNSKVYYGFAGWKIKTGGEYIKTHNNGDVLPLDAEIVFESLPYPSKNCTSAEIVFETTWTKANVQTGNNISTMLSRFSGGTYETNFAVLTGSYTTAWTGNKNATITSVYPDGSTDSRNGVSTRLNLTLNNGYTIKYEYIHINDNNSTFTMGSGTKMLYLGRGIANSTAGGVCCNLIQGYDGNINSGGLTYTLKIESGIYNYLSFIKGYDGSQTGNTVTGTVAVKGVLGCDYDRAANNNSNLKIQQHAIMGYASNNAVLLKSPAAGAEVLNVTFKSGSLNSSTTSAGTADVAQSFYIGIGGGYSPGYRIFTMEGGEMWSLAAGICQNTAETNSIRFRIKGGLIKGSIYGSAANANSYGYKQMILTGGHVKGWIAGGGNGTSSNGGVTTGSTYIYVGGDCRVDSEGSNTKINSSLGGQVFGSGSGIENTTNWGQLLYGSNVVVADNAYVERDVFGGGNFGWTEQNATIYITGTKASVRSVYGGANQNEGEQVRIYMTGGTVREGLYGGSNMSGDISGDVAMQINGGQVGTPSLPANIHGGGYGNRTTVEGNVTLTLGSNTTDPGVTVYGDVYGGSALGTVNNANSDKTEVTLNCGTINGSLYGGGLGDATNAAAVNGKVTVTTNGGRVTGAVYGCNNVNGAPANTVTVNINNTATPLAGQEFALNAVYGGGNKANYTYNVGPVVNVYAGYVANVFGGGNEATVAKTDVNIFGGHLLGNVYGGGNKADITTGGTDVDVTGGRIYNVFGGNNESGNITGEVHVDIANTSLSVAAVGVTDIDYVYGGGNLAAYTATGTNNFPIVNMINGQVRYALYGGGYGESAIVTGNPQVTMTGGTVGYTETVDDKQVVRGGDIFGGGNAAAVEGNTSVVITKGEVKHNVYGGGNQAKVTGKTNVVIGE